MSESEREIYQGTALALVDDKGRVAIPSSLRGAVIANTPSVEMKDGFKLSLAAHPRERCLIGYDKAWANIARARATEREERFPTEDGEIDYNIKRKSSGASDEVGFDPSGRFIMPGFLRHYGRIQKHAFFYGVFDYFEIWDPQTLIDCEGAPQVMKEAARFFMAEKGVTL